MKKDSWIVVANSSVARLFKLDKLKLIEMDSLIHPQSRMQDRDLVTDHPGQTNESMGTSRSQMEVQNPPKKMEAINFAKQIADHLDLARAKGQLEKIYLAATPSFLGLIRQEMSQTTEKLVEAEIDKDITHMKPDVILGYFPIGL